MENELERRWRQALRPFDGETIYTPEYTPLLSLVAPLAAAIEKLQALSGHISLIKFDDWHEHDGYVKDSVQASWAELMSLATSEHALIGASTGESYVSKAYCPVDHNWLLRVDVPDLYDTQYIQHDDPILIYYGRFDITCEVNLALELYTMALETSSSLILKMPAKAFFDMRYNG